MTMQSIIEYLLHQLESEDVEEINVNDVHSFLLSLMGNEMGPEQMIQDIGLYELELNRVAWEGQVASSYLQRLLIAPAVPAKRYVVGL